MSVPDVEHDSPRRPRGRPGYSRDDVLRRTIDLFNRRGYDGTSIGDISKDLGITKSAVFYHFDSKEDILAAALHEALEELDQLVAQASEPTSGISAYDRLRRTVEAAVRILVTHLPAVTLLLRVRGNSALENDALRRRRSIDAGLEQLVREAVAEGGLRSDIEPELLTRLLFGMVNSLVDWYRPGGALTGSSLATNVTSVLFDGLARTPTTTTL